MEYKSGYSRFWPGKVLKPTLSAGDGRLRVSLWHSGKTAKKKVETLVCEAFHGPRPEGLLVCHRDDIATNNAADNLYWGTPSQNNADAIRNGRNPQLKKTRCKFDHEFDKVYRRADGSTFRYCSQCNRDRKARKRESRKQG